MATRHGVDLAELDAVSANLDLRVGATEKFDIPVGTPPRHVARLVDACTGLGVEGRRNVLAGGQLRISGIAEAHADAADVEITRDVDRAGVQVLVEDVVAGVLYRSAVRNARPRGIDLLDRKAVGPDRRLGRSPQADDPDVGERGFHDVRGMYGNPVPAHEDQAERVRHGARLVIARRQEGNELHQRGGCRVPERDRFCRQRVQQTSRLLDVLSRGQPDGSTGGEHAEDVVDGEVETQRRDEEYPVVRADLERVVDPLDQVDRGMVRDHHTFGCAGRPGREDDVCQIPGGSPSRRVVLRHSRDPGRGVELVGSRLRRLGALVGDIDADDVGEPGEWIGRQDGRHQGVLGEYAVDPQRVDDPVPTFGWGVGLDRNVCATGLQDAQQGRNHLDGAFHQNRDLGTGSDTESLQIVRDLIRLRVDVRVRPAAVLEEHGRGVRRPPCPLLEQLMDAKILRVRSLGVVPPMDELEALVFGEQRQLRQAGLRKPHQVDTDLAQVS